MRYELIEKEADQMEKKAKECRLECIRLGAVADALDMQVESLRYAIARNRSAEAE